MTTTFRIEHTSPGLFGPVHLEPVFVEANAVVTTEDGRSTLLVVEGGRTVASFPTDRVTAVIDTAQERIPEAIIGEAGQVEPVNGEGPDPSETDKELRSELEELSGRFGGFGLALQAATYTDPEVLIARLLDRLDGHELHATINRAAQALRLLAE